MTNGPVGISGVTELPQSLPKFLSVTQGSRLALFERGTIPDATLDGHQNMKFMIGTRNWISASFKRGAAPFPE